VWLAIDQPRRIPPEPLSASTDVPKHEAAPAAPAAQTPASSGPADAARPRTTTPSHQSKTPVDRAPQTNAASEPGPSQPSPEPSPAATQQASGPPPSPVVTGENPGVLDPSTRTPAVVAPAPPDRDVLVDPRAIREVKPVYPPAAVSAELEGHVILEGVIGIDGKVSHITVVRFTHSLFIEPARNAWLQYAYTPGGRNGVPEPRVRRQTFTFKLRQ